MFIYTEMVAGNHLLFLVSKGDLDDRRLRDYARIDEPLTAVIQKDKDSDHYHILIRKVPK